MSPERANAYRRVLTILEDLGPSKLQREEIERIRHVADTLLFTHDLTADEAGQEAIGDGEQLCRALVDSGRWERVTANRLAESLYLCGPPPAEQLAEPLPEPLVAEAA